MRYDILRGRDQIGGSCVEVAGDDGTRILLDVGMPLYDEEHGDFPFGMHQRPTVELLEKGVLLDIPGLYAANSDEPAFAAVIVTHSHLDHYGLAHHAHPAIPVYVSAGTLAILEVNRIFQGEAAQPADLRPLPDDAPLQIGSLTVTGIPVDHSAPDSRAVLVEADGQKLLYSGDLRAHGRTGFRFEKLLRDTRLGGLDWLILENTTRSPSASGHGYAREEDVEDELVGLAKANPDKLIAVMASAQNLDRVVSCYRAAKQTGRLLVIDVYQAYVLMKLKGLSDALPQYTWDDVRVVFTHSQREKLVEHGLLEVVNAIARVAHVRSDALAAEPGRYLMDGRANSKIPKLFELVGKDHLELVWSMWGGYLKRDHSPVRDWAQENGLTLHRIHSGGHAWPEDLDRLEAALHPGKIEAVHWEKG